MDRAPDHIFATGILLHRDALPSLFLKRLCDRRARPSAHNYRHGSVRAPQQVPRGDRLRPGRTADAGDGDPQTRSHGERQEQLSHSGPTFLHYIMTMKQSTPRCTQQTTHIAYTKFRYTLTAQAHIC